MNYGKVRFMFNQERLMISIKKMSGGRMGNKGYLNYLKNNFDLSVPEGKFVVEDKFGNKSIRENPYTKEI